MQIVRPHPEANVAGCRRARPDEERDGADEAKETSQHDGLLQTCGEDTDEEAELERSKPGKQVTYHSFSGSCFLASAFSKGNTFPAEARLAQKFQSENAARLDQTNVPRLV